MGLRKEYRRHSRAVTRGPRWKALRMQALERDGWQCVQCGSRVRLECDHIEPVRDRPDLAWSLTNLQILCGRCHARKTRIEIGLADPLSKPRQAWRDLVANMRREPSSKEENHHA